MIDPISIECPDCDAEPGERCQSRPFYGQSFPTDIHDGRFEYADAENEARAL